MATQVLHPQDYFVRPPPASFSRRCNYYGYNNRAATTRSYRKPVNKLDLKKPVSVSSSKQDTALVLKRSSSDDSVTRKNSGSTVEKVMILRRGKSLDSALVEVKNDMYAGSAFAASPSPSELPLPSFPMKKLTVDDTATQDLRRLLRLV